MSRPRSSAAPLPALRARGHVEARDVRMMLVPRLVGFAVASLVIIPTGLPTDVHFYALLVAAGIGALLVPATIFAPTRLLRRRAFDTGMVVDLVVITLLVHLTGGLASPLLPMVLAWATLGILAYRGIPAVVFTTGLVATVALQPLINSLFHPHPVVGGPYTHVALVLLLAVGIAVSVEIAARVLDGSHQALDELASTDALTGTYNRRAFNVRLEQLLSVEPCPSFTLALVDLDYFKHINDEFGHLVGDRVLAAFADRLADTLRDTDEIYRIGGEEFAVILPQTTTQRACRVLRRVQRELRIRPPHRGIPPVTFSAGLAAGSDLDPFETADQRLYQAKRAGRDRVTCSAALEVGAPTG
jgi:diguanylate cyclase